MDDLRSLFFELFELSLESFEEELLESDEDLDSELLLEFDESEDELLPFFLVFFFDFPLIFLSFLPPFLSFFLSLPDF